MLKKHTANTKKYDQNHGKTFHWSSINKPNDDPAGSSISTKMIAQIQGFQAELQKHQ